MERWVTNPGSALGEAIGKLIEADLAAAVREVAESFDHSVRSAALRNHLGNKHQIDTVISDSAAQPVILIEPKYLRYKKHNWDKGSRLCIAHYSLRRTYPSIRKSIGVLAGEWTDASLRFIRSFGVETHRIPFDHIADVLERYRIPFRWDEKDKLTPAAAWRRFCQLSEEEQTEMATAITNPVRQAVRQSVETTLRSDPSAPRRVEAVELSIRTSEGEHLVYSFNSVSEAIQRLLTFVTDVEDLQHMLR
ncbi:MAG: hypothetical protein QHJ81_02475 [Anaerolineae bacterium]|nr:hypothetical protein [Anaerolineae bacterium]